VKKKSPKYQNLSLKDNFDVWELGVPSHKVTQKDTFLTKNSFKLRLLTEQPPYLLLCKGTLTCAPSDESKPKVLSSEVEKLLKEFDDLFPSDDPTGMPPFRGIEHQIGFVPGASLPNRQAYKTNPEETKEIEYQVQKLLDKGWFQKSLSP